MRLVFALLGVSNLFGCGSTGYKRSYIITETVTTQEEQVTNESCDLESDCGCGGKNRKKKNYQ